MIFPKKQAQRLIPEYLLDYTTKLNESHPDPTESWGGGSGGSYTSGDGITISSENVISVDNTIAKKSEIPTNYVTLDTEQTITKSKTIDAQLNFGDGAHNSILINADYANKPLISLYENTSGGEFSIGVDDGTNTSSTGAYFTYEDDKGLREYRLPYKDREGLTTCTLATNLDLPTKTSDLTNDSGYITNITSSDITTALGYTPGTSNFSGSYNDLTDKPTLATVATSGSYNDLNDKPTIPTNYVTTDTIQTINITKYFGGGTLVVDDGIYTLSHYTDKFSFINGTGMIHFELPISKPSGNAQVPAKYTFAMTDDIPDTTNFVTTNTAQTISGAKTFNGGLFTENTTFGLKMNIVPGRFIYDYNNQGTIETTLFDLPTEKTPGTEQEPTTYTIATKDDIHNPTITFTQGGTTKGTITLNQSGDQTIEFDAGGGGGSTTNMVTTDTNQEITGEKTFVGMKRIKFKQSSQYDRVGFTGYDANGTEIGYLEMSKDDSDFPSGTTSNILGYWGNRSAPNPSKDVMLGFKYYTKDSDGTLRDYRLVVPPRYNEVRATRYIPISVNGNTADNTGNINVPTQTLVFTLADNSTVTLNVMTSATASTTTTS